MVQAALESVALLQSLLQKANQLDVTEQPPWSGVDKAWRDLAGETFYIKVRPDTLQQVGHEIQIGIQRECDEVGRMLCKLALHGCAFYYLQLVELDRMQGKAVDDGCVSQHVLYGFAGKTEDEVRSLGQSPGSGHLQCPYSVRDGVASVDASEGTVVAGFDTVFYYYDMLPGQGCQIVQFGLVYAVRSGAYDDSGNQRMAQGFLVDLTQPVQGCVGVGIGLEVGQKPCGITVTDPMELYALVYLLVYGCAGSAVAWVEGRVVTVGTAAGTHGTVPVWTGEAGVHDYFLQAFSVGILEITYI